MWVHGNSTLQESHRSTGAPSYVSRVKQGQFPAVLRNLHIPAILLNTIIMVLVLAIIPLKTVLQGANVLSVLAELVCPVLSQPSPYSIMFSRQGNGYGPGSSLMLSLFYVVVSLLVRRALSLNVHV